MEEDSVKSKMKAVCDNAASDIASIRTGGASTSLVSDLVVSVYGGQQKLKVQELATISAVDVQTVTIDPWDKSIVGEISKGIMAANVNLNPAIDGEIIRITVPPLTGEDRQKLIRLLSVKLEATKVIIRQIRSEAMKDIRDSFEEKQIGEDDKFNQEKRVQEITDDFINELENIGAVKKSELLG